MSQIRKRYSKQFKAQVALSAIREEDSISSLSSKYGVMCARFSGHKIKQRLQKSDAQMLQERGNQY